MKDFNEYITEGGILLGKTVQMGNRRGRIIQTVKSGATSRYDDTYLVKFQDGTKIEMHDVQIRPFLESVELDEARAEDYKLKKTRKKVDKQDGEDDITTQHYDVMLKGKKVGTAEEDDYYGYVDATIHGKTIPTLSGRDSAERQIQKYLKSKRGSKIVAESVELDEYRRQDVYAIVDKKGKVVAANLTKQNAHKEISRHRDATIVLDPDAKVGDTLKFFAKEEAPTNSMGAGGSPHFGQDGPIQGTDGGLTGDKQNEQFAGVEVFDLSPEEYQNCVNGRNKYERWSRKLNMEDGANQSIRRYSHRNPDKDIIVRDSRTGMMAYLKRKK